MGVDYDKCDMCNECYSDCGDNYPMDIEGSEKCICPECMEEHLEKKGTKITYDEETHEPMYQDYEEGWVRKEYNPFSDEVTISREEYNKLKRSHDFLNCLKGHGVDNWENFGVVCREMEKEYGN